MGAVIKLGLFHLLMLGFYRGSCLRKPLASCLIYMPDFSLPIKVTVWDYGGGGRNLMTTCASQIF